MCDIFYIAHLGVRYEIYALAFPFDLRCQSGILHFEVTFPTLFVVAVIGIAGNVIDLY